MEQLRITKTEDRMIAQKCREVNKTLIMNDHPPVQESELVHIILGKVLPKVKATTSGQIYIEEE